MKRFALILMVLTVAGCGHKKQGPIPPLPSDSVTADPGTFHHDNCIDLSTGKPCDNSVVFMTPAQAKASGMGEIKIVKPKHARFVPGKAKPLSDSLGALNIRELGNMTSSFNVIATQVPGPIVEIIYNTDIGTPQEEHGLMKIKDADGKLILTVAMDGTVKMFNGHTADEAATTFWMAMAKTFPIVCGRDKPIAEVQPK